MFDPLFLVFAVSLASIATIVGGLIPLHPKIKFNLNEVVGFASGIVIGTSLFELIPKSNPSDNWPFIGFGFFLFYIIEMAVTIHVAGEGECKMEHVGIPALIGISADNIVDGVAIAIGFLTNPLLGIFIALAVIVHELPQGLTTTVVLKNEGWNNRKIIVILIISAVLYPIGAAFSVLIPGNIYEIIVAFVAGEFLYIGAGELLPEAHRSFNKKIVSLVMLGVLIIAVLEVGFGL